MGQQQSSDAFKACSIQIYSVMKEGNSLFVVLALWCSLLATSFVVKTCPCWNPEAGTGGFSY